MFENYTRILSSQFLHQTLQDDLCASLRRQGLAMLSPFPRYHLSSSSSVNHSPRYSRQEERLLRSLVLFDSKPCQRVCCFPWLLTCFRCTRYPHNAAPHTLAIMLSSAGLVAVTPAKLMIHAFQCIRPPSAFCCIPLTSLSASHHMPSACWRQIESGAKQID